MGTPSRRLPNRTAPLVVLALTVLWLPPFSACRQEPRQVEPPAVAQPATETARVNGRVLLRGTPPPETEMPLDPSCGKLHTTRPKTRHYHVATDGGLADVFVQVTRGLTGGPFPPPTTPAIIDQKDCLYVPSVLGAQTRQIIRVKNSDPLLHNVHPTPTVPGNREYNKAHLPKAPDLDFAWEHPEVFLLFKCDVHPWMFAYVGLVDHPFHAVTADDGAFTLPELPPGQYVIEARHHRAGRVAQPITVVAGETKTLELTLNVPAAQ